jgi:beta-phosphoglucomutase
VPIAAIIFDVDGVLVDSPHERAWRETLAELVKGPWSHLLPETTYTPDRFDSALYQALVAGKPRKEGALAILDHFRFPDARHWAIEYAREKQNRIVALIDSQQFQSFPDAIRFVLDCANMNHPLAVASSSKNAGQLLAQIHVTLPEPKNSRCLRDFFQVDVSGRDLLCGKPAPDIFLAASNELNVGPSNCLVVEDAIAGIQAAKAGGMCALGIARMNDFAELRQARADLVVTSLDDVSRKALAAGKLEFERKDFAA